VRRHLHATERSRNPGFPRKYRRDELERGGFRSSAQTAGHQHEPGRDGGASHPARQISARRGRREGRKTPRGGLAATRHSIWFQPRCRSFAVASALQSATMGRAHGSGLFRQADQVGCTAGIGRGPEEGHSSRLRLTEFRWSDYNGERPGIHRRGDGRLFAGVRRGNREGALGGALAGGGTGDADYIPASSERKTVRGDRGGRPWEDRDETWGFGGGVRASLRAA